MDYKDISVVYEDNHILVAVKPQNVPVQADSSGDDDMLSTVKDDKHKIYFYGVNNGDFKASDIVEESGKTSFVINYFSNISSSRS